MTKVNVTKGIKKKAVVARNAKFVLQVFKGKT